MENKKVQYLINIINDMDLKDKLRLAICMSQSKWAGLIYNTKENYEKFDKILKEVDEEYRTTFQFETSVELWYFRKQCCFCISNSGRIRKDHVCLSHK